MIISNFFYRIKLLFSVIRKFMHHDNVHKKMPINFTVQLLNLKLSFKERDMTPKDLIIIGEA